MNPQYFHTLSQKIDLVFRNHPPLFGHRDRFPWLTGSLGDPHAGIWFIAENPSLTQVERAIDPTGGPPTSEAQWWASRGDKLFREMLVKHGLKSGTIDSPGGWHCYITNVIKEADYAKKWRAKTQGLRNQAAEIWSDVLRWELENSRPVLVVIFGDPAKKLLNYLVDQNAIKLPETFPIYHYQYIGSRPESSGKRRPSMDPERIEEYSETFANIITRFNQPN